MTRCKGCGEEFDPEELTRHERDGMVHVHCPNCGRRLGDWNEHSGHADETAAE